MICSTFLYLVLVITFASFVRTGFINSCTEKKTIALTFDDGPFKYTNKLVDYIISQQDVKITFFHVAKLHYPYATDTSEYQETMKKAHDHGFQIASHTYEHHISSNREEFKKSLNDMDDFIESVTGDRPRYFRAPKGVCNEQCQDDLDEWGYRLIQWDTDTKDWDIETSGSAQRRIEDSINILKKKFSEERDNYIILMHDTESYTVSDIVPWIIEKSGMKEKGYRFVTVAECLGDGDGMYTPKTFIDDGTVNDANTPIINGNSTIENDPNDYQNSNENNNNVTQINTSNSNNYSNDINDVDNDNSKVYTDNSIYHNLDSGAFMSLKPMTFLSYICLGLLSFLFISLS